VDMAGKTNGAVDMAGKTNGAVDMAGKTNGAVDMAGKTNGKCMPKVNKRAATASSSSDDEYVYVVGNVHGDTRHPRSAVTVNGQCVELLIGSG
ncbi:hypothetical protein LSAT2_013197, partial [Lamellibrachia satsuma]